MVFSTILTSLWGFEVVGMAAWAVAPPVEGHDDEAVLGERRQSRQHAVVSVPGERQRLFVAVVFLKVGQASHTPPVDLERDARRRVREFKMSFFFTLSWTSKGDREG